MHLPGPLRRARAHRQPRLFNFCQHATLSSTTAPRPGRGAVRFIASLSADHHHKSRRAKQFRWVLLSSPTKLILVSLRFSVCLLSFFAVCSSNIRENKKQIRCGTSSPGARLKKRLDGNPKIRKLGYQNNACRLWRLGHRRVGLGIRMGPAG